MCGGASFAISRWLAADMNVAPDYTLDAVEAIVTHPDVHVEGMLLTLKLLDWGLAERVARLSGAIDSWGYPQVAARQLQHGRQEICVVGRSAGGHGPQAAARSADCPAPGCRAANDFKC